MTDIRVTPEDDIQAIIDESGGPGVAIVFDPGTYRQEIVLRGEMPTHNGNAASPMRLVLQKGATLNPASSKIDTIRFAAASHVILEGEGKINGAGDDTRQAVHIHSAPKKGLYPTGIQLRDGLRILPKRGDGIKISESIATVLENIEVDGQYLRSEKESLVDFNKFRDATMRDVHLTNHPNTALVLKGGGVGALLERVVVDNVTKGIEIGGYEGSGYWDQINNSWAAKDVILRDSDIEADDYPIRFIDAHDVRVENTALSGAREMLITNTVEINRGEFRNSNVVVNGEVVVALQVPVVPPSDPTPPADPTPQEEEENAAAAYGEGVDVVAKGTGGKMTIRSFEKGRGSLVLEGFGLSWEELTTHLNQKSQSLVIMDLRPIDGPRLTLKGKDIRPLVEEDIRLVG